MKKIAICLTLSMVMALHLQVACASEQKTSLAPFKKWEGKYISDKVDGHGFFETANLEQRLKELLGEDRYDELIWFIATDRTLLASFQKNDNVLFGEVMNFYLGGFDDALELFQIHLDLDNDIIAVCWDRELWLQEGLPPEKIECQSSTYGEFYFTHTPLSFEFKKPSQ